MGGGEIGLAEQMFSRTDFMTLPNGNRQRNPTLFIGTNHRNSNLAAVSEGRASR